MKKTPLEHNNEQRLVELMTFSNGKMDAPPKLKYDEILWVNSEEDRKVLFNEKKLFTIRIVTQDMWDNGEKIIVDNGNETV